MGGLTRRRLRAMRARWERDMEALLAAYPEHDPARNPESLTPPTETIRNIQTAIGEIHGVITARRRGDRRTQESDHG